MVEFARDLSGLEAEPIATRASRFATTLRHRVETFREMTNDLAKPADLFPELYQDWGDEVAYTLQLGRGECAV